jgi:G3E family GTPase
LQLLDGLNGWAERLHGGASPAEVLFAKAPAVAARRRLSAQAVMPEAAHTGAIHTLSLVLAAPPTRLAFAKTLGRFASERGIDLLRVKGLIAFTDRADRVAVIHAVQHTIYRPEWLLQWPDADTRSRLVFITRGIDDADIFSRLAAFAPVAWSAAESLAA